MKQGSKLTILGAAALAAAVTGRAQILSEGFTYPNGDITTESGGVWAIQATAVSGAPTIQIQGDQAVISQPTFTSPSNERVGRTIGQTFGLTGGNPTTVFASFDATWSALPVSTTGAYIFSFGTDTSTGATFYGRVGANLNNASAGQFSLATANANWSVGNAKTFPTSLSLNVTYDIVVEYNLNTKQTTLWVDPANSGSTSVTATDTVGTQNNITAVSLRQGVTSTGQGAPGTVTIDNLLVGSTFASVSAVPEPAEYGAAFGAALAGFALWRRRRA